MCVNERTCSVLVYEVLITVNPRKKQDLRLLITLRGHDDLLLYELNEILCLKWHGLRIVQCV